MLRCFVVVVHELIHGTNLCNISVVLRAESMQAVIGCKYLYLRKCTYYVRVKVPKRLGAREIRFCLRTKKLSVAVVVLEWFLPIIPRLKQLVIRSRTLETNLICLQFSQIKDAM